MSDPDLLFSTPGPRVFTMAPGAAFLDKLAGVMAQSAARTAGPWALSDAVVLTPTRRAARALADAFVRSSGTVAATLLPSIRALGDVDADEPPFEPGDIALTLPPALEPGQRRFELAALAHAMLRARDPGASLASALPLADALGVLLDDASSETGVDLTELEKSYERLPAHFQDASRFLSIVRTAWPARLKELGRVDPVARRDALMRSLAKQWSEAPPRLPVIAAGSTGTAPATAELLRVVASLPQGCVVLPGLDGDLDEAAWRAVGDQHPQGALKRLLAALGVSRSDVRPWPTVDEDAPAAARRRLVNEALRPVDETADWLERIADMRRVLPGDDPVADGLADLSLVEAANEDEEARVVALAIRRELGAPDATAMLVTPDRGLARRAEKYLGRWGIDADASSGEPLAETGVGAFLQLVLDLALDPGDPIALCALLKHPLCRLGRDEDNLRAAAAGLECAVLRGVRIGGGLGALRQKTASENERALIDAVTEALDAFGETGAASVASWAEGHARAAEAFAAAHDADGASRLWVGEAGEGAAALVSELLQDAAALPDATLAGYDRLFARLSAGRAVRARYRGAAAVRILGPLEARLQSAGLVILGGLNEGVWPAPPAQDPFLSRPMRKAAHLPPAERRYGLSAHDFAQLCCAPRVLLTRAQRSEGAPAVASRWLWRLKTLAAGAGETLENRDAGAPDFAAIARALDRHAGPIRVAPEPEPRPPLAARLRKVSVTRVRDWVRDPYAFYARRILKLEPLAALGREADARERGIALHESLHSVLRDAGDALAEDFESMLETRAIAALSDQGLSPAQMAREAPRMRRLAAWFAHWERERRAEGWRPALLETTGTMTFQALGGDFTVTARADRLDAGPDGWAILDYKTGQPPTVRQALYGLEPQMPLEAAVMAAGGFDGAPAQTPVQLAYVRTRGGPLAGEFKDMSAGRNGASPQELADAGLAGLRRLVDAYDVEATPYKSQTRAALVADKGDYDRLARRKEWAGPLTEEEGA